MNIKRYLLVVLIILVTTILIISIKKSIMYAPDLNSSDKNIPPGPPPIQFDTVESKLGEAAVSQVTGVTIIPLKILEGGERTLRASVSSVSSPEVSKEYDFELGKKIQTSWGNITLTEASGNFTFKIQK